MRVILLLTCLVLAGCATPREPTIGRGEGDINVPKCFHPTFGWIEEAPSPYERYLEMYRQGYWACIERYTQDINYIPKKSDAYGNGWPSEIEGYGDGYTAAEKDMARNLKLFGKERTKQYLKEVWQSDG
jgi:hypothetical protein